MISILKAMIHLMFKDTTECDTMWYNFDSQGNNTMFDDTTESATVQYDAIIS